MQDLFLHNGLIVTEEDVFQGGVAVKDGKISQLVCSDCRVEANETIDLKGKLLIPGVIDEHSHWSEPGRDWEGYTPGSMAAAAGGVTTALDMPLNDLPPTINRQNLLKKRELTRDKAVIDYAFWGGFIENNLEALEEMHQEGVIGFKAFLTHASDFGWVNDDLLYAGLKRMRDLGNVIGLHAENESVNTFLRKQFQTQGRTDRNVWPESRPPEAELDAVKRAVHWAKVSGGRLHVLHVSIAKGVQEVQRAKNEGVRVTVETCSHYLFFDNNDYLRIGPELRCAPPIRSREEVEKLWKCVLEGQVDAIASDHSPCPHEMQERGLKNIWDAFGGVTGIQLLLPAILTEGVHKRGMSWSLLVRLLCANPARISGLYPKKGALVPGADADMTVIDPDQEWSLSAGDLFSRHKHSAFVGRRFRGRVERTLVRGTTVYLDGKITAEPGYGRLVRRGER